MAVAAAASTESPVCIELSWAHRLDAHTGSPQTREQRVMMPASRLGPWEVGEAKGRGPGNRGDTAHGKGTELTHSGKHQERIPRKRGEKTEPITQVRGWGITRRRQTSSVKGRTN